MDIKGIVRSIMPLTQSAQAVSEKRRSQAGSASDRDANGRQEQAEEQPKRHLTDEEVTESMKFIENLPGVKDNRLTVRLEEKDGIKVVYVEDAAGKVVRRLSEVDLGALLKQKNSAKPKQSGNLLNRAI
jgi:predicted DNA binding CopG/RHH family protein